jgi:PTH1 family peptidyl-tRNA hydrolase
MASQMPTIYVISLGNPAPHTSTLHSAGHLVLKSLIASGAISGQPAFSNAPFGKKKSIPASVGPRFTFLQCPTFMNVSGGFVSRVWKDDILAKTLPTNAGIVLVHDDLEVDIGTVKIREWGRSARGHNGVKSVHEKLKLPAGAKCARISVGIGRPVERDAMAVSSYVLGPMPEKAREFLDGKAPELVLQKLEELEGLWFPDAQDNEAEEPAVRKPTTRRQ